MYRWVCLSLCLFHACCFGGQEPVALDKIIGQLIVVGFRGTTIEDRDWIAEQVASGQVGGVVLFDYDFESKKYVRNIESPEQLKTLCQELQKRATIPLLIAADQEGGRITRLSVRNRFPTTHPAQTLGERNQIELTLRQGKLIGETLSSNGLNLNLAPVVDLNINPDSPCIGKKDRSFSDDPDIVAANAKAYIQGHHDCGVLTTLKHFPGHGSAANDTHEGFTDITKTWSEVELKPYQELIASNLADVIMTAHVYNGKLDSHYPASLSKNITTGLLRKQLNYDGVIITDDLQMGAITSYYSLETTIKLALDAGADLLMFANQMAYDPDIAPKSIAIIKRLVASGELPQERIEASYNRVQALKARLHFGKASGS